MKLCDVESVLRSRLAGPLPGGEAHVRLAPQPRPSWPRALASRERRDAAGLIVLFPVDGHAHLLLTVRASHLASHAGQVSLPGGAVEPGEAIEAAALREAHEEIGLDPAAVRIVGRLTPLDIPVSGFVLHPVVATVPARPELQPAGAEVERILDVDLEDLADPSRRRVRRGFRELPDIEIPYIDVHGAELWGATAMVLSELLWVIDAGM